MYFWRLEVNLDILGPTFHFRPNPGVLKVSRVFLGRGIGLVLEKKLYCESSFKSEFFPKSQSIALPHQKKNPNQKKAPKQK